MNKAFLGTKINASGPGKNLTWLYHWFKELLLALKIKYISTLLLYFMLQGRKIFRVGSVCPAVRHCCFIKDSYDIVYCYLSVTENTDL
jgi:hypothetical protein